MIPCQHLFDCLKCQAKIWKKVIFLTIFCLFFYNIYQLHYFRLDILPVRMCLNDKDQKPWERKGLNIVNNSKCYWQDDFLIQQVSRNCQKWWCSQWTFWKVSFHASRLRYLGAQVQHGSGYICRGPDGWLLLNLQIGQVRGQQYWHQADQQGGQCDDGAGRVPEEQHNICLPVWLHQQVWNWLRL